MTVAVVPEGHIETVEQLIDMMAEAISPHAFSEHSSEIEKAFARSAAQRALLICAPIILTEAAATLDHPDGRNAEAVKIILDLKNLF